MTTNGHAGEGGDGEGRPREKATNEGDPHSSASGDEDAGREEAKAKSTGAASASPEREAEAEVEEAGDDDRAAEEGAHDKASGDGEAPEKKESRKDIADGDIPPEKDTGEKLLSHRPKNQSDNAEGDGAVEDGTPPDEEIGASKGEARSRSKTVYLRADDPRAEGGPPGGPPTMGGDADAGKLSEDDEVVLVSSNEKRRVPDDGLMPAAKRRMEESTSDRPHDQQQHFPMMNPAMHPLGMMNPAMHPQRMMNPQVMPWGHPMPPHPGVARGMTSREAPPHATAQPVLLGRTHRAILTLPPPPWKLGVLLDDNAKFGAPELKGVTANSPIRDQIPEDFRSGCCIVSLKSPAIGLVEPKTAQQCAHWIAKSQMGQKLEVTLVETTNRSAAAKEQKGRKSKGGRKSAGEHYEYNRFRRNALLDFFSCEHKPSVGKFLWEHNLPASSRSALSRVLQSDKRLTYLCDQRHVLRHRQEAYGIIEKKFPNVNVVRDALVEFFRNSKYDTPGAFCRERNLDLGVCRAMEQTLADDAKLGALVDKRDGVGEPTDALRRIRARFPEQSSQKVRLGQKHKSLLLELFAEHREASVAALCAERPIYALERAALVRFVDNHKRLSELLGLRRDAERREEAINIIEALFVDIFKRNSDPAGDMGSQPSDSTPAAETETPAAETPSDAVEFFSPDNIKRIAEGLDFDCRPRVSRDGSKEIEIHTKKSHDERMTLLVLDFVNRAARGRILTKAEKDKLRLHCAQILFYDHGYKKASGFTKLTKVWEPRLEQAYISGADTTPLVRKHVGSTSYIERIEREHPGLISQLYELAEASTGKDAPMGEKAMFMNEHSIDNPDMPEVHLNKDTLSYWTNKQKGIYTDKWGNRVKGLAESKAEKDLSIEKIEKQHPGLIDELYKFAVEAMGSDASLHILATCMNERSKEDVEEHPTLPRVVMNKKTLPLWLKKRGL